MINKTYPNVNNFCGGNFQDWLEVNLLKECNGRCSWCIEKNGFHPETSANWKIIADQAILTGKKNIILLGGEPTLYPYLKEIIQYLNNANLSVWITTNGSRLSPNFIRKNLVGIKGINISIHSWDLSQNEEITGVKIKNLLSSIKTLKEMNISIRFNCNCIAGYIDNYHRIEDYILLAKSLGVTKVRFAELKQDDESFVDLAKILNYRYGLNDDPFVCGCNKNAVIHEVDVNFRQMCGLQTSQRKKPYNPVQFAKQVLYYDGKIYNGWQTKESQMNSVHTKVLSILKAVENGKMTSEEALVKIFSSMDNQISLKHIENVNTGAGCQY